MDDKCKDDLSDILNKLNIALHELADLTEIIVLGLESESMNNMELAISCVCTLKRLLEDAGLMSEDAINVLENSV